MHDYDNFRYVGTEKIIELSKKENELLKILIENKGSIVLIDEILFKLYKNKSLVNALEQLIWRLRKKLKNEITIRTRRGFGYGIKMHI